MGFIFFFLSLLRLYTAEVKENIDPVHVIYTVDIVDPESLPMTFTQSWSPSKPSWITFDSACKNILKNSFKYI